MDTDFERAVALHQAGLVNEAVALYEKVILREPGHAEALRLLGLALASLGRWEPALAYLGRAALRAPSNPTVLLNLADTLHRSGQLTRAVAAYRSALAADPGQAQAHNNLGLALRSLGSLDEAISAYREAIRADPAYAPALANLGAALLLAGQPEEALAICRRGVALNPGLAEMQNNLGNALQAAGLGDEALKAFDHALSLRPGFPEAHNNRGAALKAANRLEEAEQAFRAALALRPAYAEALNNLGNTQAALGRFDAAIESYRRSRVADPAQGDAPFLEAVARLAAGDLPAGFELYEHRWRSEMKGMARAPSPRLWLGEESLQGKTILLYAEQGLGDTLQFVRYAPLVAALGAVVSLEVQAPLAGLLSRLPGIARVYARNEPLPAFDFHCPLLSLPRALRTDLPTIPAGVPYLTASTGRLAAWRARIPDGPCRVGVVWAGNPKHRHDRHRSLPLAVMQDLFSVPGCRFFSLQAEVPSEDRSRLAAIPGLTDLSGRLGDFDDTAAAVSLLDLTISVDTSVVHLAGALGRPVWVLLPYAPDWRWMREREDSPWYPGARLFRQAVPGDWAAPVDRVKRALLARATG